MIINMNMSSYVIEEVPVSKHLYEDEMQWSEFIPELGMNVQQQKLAITVDLATLNIDKLLLKMSISEIK